jgi:hypothetical protein
MRRKKMKANIPLSFNSIMEVDLSEIEDAILFEELEERNLHVVETDVIDIIREIYNAKTKNQCYNELVNKLINEALGRIL